MYDDLFVNFIFTGELWHLESFPDKTYRRLLIPENNLLWKWFGIASANSSSSNLSCTFLLNTFIAFKTFRCFSKMLYEKWWFLLLWETDIGFWPYFTRKQVDILKNSIMYWKLIYQFDNFNYALISLKNILVVCTITNQYPSHIWKESVHGTWLT